MITGIRFEHHAAQVAAGEPPDNLIDPEELAPIARTDLREALHVVRRAQKRIGAGRRPDLRSIRVRAVLRGLCRSAVAGAKNA